jgi:hypothetical protein
MIAAVSARNAWLQHLLRAQAHCSEGLRVAIAPRRHRLRAALEALAAELDATPASDLIDYGRRRDALRAWSFPAGDWHQLATDLRRQQSPRVRATDWGPQAPGRVGAGLGARHPGRAPLRPLGPPRRAGIGPPRACPMDALRDPPEPQRPPRASLRRTRRLRRPARRPHRRWRACRTGRYWPTRVCSHTRRALHGAPVTRSRSWRIAAVSGGPGSSRCANCSALCRVRVKMAGVRVWLAGVAASGPGR